MNAVVCVGADTDDMGNRRRFFTEELFGGETVKAIDARRLHEFLEVETEFSHWIRRRIEQFRFREGVDFCLAGQGELDSTKLTDQKRTHGGDRRSKEYALTLRMAQHLCLTEETDRGEMARDWIWAREAELRRRESSPVNLRDPDTLLALLGDYGTARLR
jgi:phage anti-repressor protein